MVTGWHVLSGIAANLDDYSHALVLVSCTNKRFRISYACNSKRRSAGALDDKIFADAETHLLLFLWFDQMILTSKMMSRSSFAISEHYIFP